MKTSQIPKIKRITAPRGAAWQVTATVNGERRKVQRYESAAAPGAAENEVRSIAVQWAAEQQGHAPKRLSVTRLCDEQQTAAERLFAKLSGPNAVARVERMAASLPNGYEGDFAGLSLTDDQARIALRLFAAMPPGADPAKLLEIARLGFTLSDQQFQIAPVLLGLLPSSLTVEQVRRFSPLWARDITRPIVTIETAVTQFLETRKVQAAQMRTYAGVLGHLTTHVGCNRALASIETAEIASFLHRYTHPTTYNKRRTDVAAFFNWAKSKELVERSPVQLIDTKAEPERDETPATIPVATAAALMRAVETEAPGLVTHFALCLFAGCRPTWREGEAFELVHRFPERRHRYFREDGVHVPGSISKTGRARVVPHAELRPLGTWLKAYPPGSLPVPTDPERWITEFRRRFEIPHDGLRHTAISAALAGGMAISRATLVFGVDESTMVTHYASLWRHADAEAFRSIVPRGSAAQPGS